MMRGTQRDRPDGSLFLASEYGKGSDGTWYACPPQATSEAFSAFQLAAQADGLATATIRWYISMLGDFINQYAAMPLERIDATLIRRWIVDLRGRESRYGDQRPQLVGGLSNESIRGYIRAMKRFINWAYLEYDLDPASSPMRKIKMPSKSIRAPKHADFAHLQMMLAACRNDPQGKRNKALLMFIADTGARAGGVVGLTMDHLDLDLRHAVVREKGDKDRAVPFSIDTAIAMRRWLEVRPKTAGNFVFCGFKNYAVGKSLHINGLHQILKRMAKDAKLPSDARVNPHAWRHGFAREFLRNGGDVGILAQLMGHSSVDVTIKSYAVFQSDELADEHRKHGPLTAYRRK